MAQSGIPFTNKVGCSIYWDSMWSNKIFYNKNNKEDIFIKYFFTNLLIDKNYLNFFKKKNLQKIYKKNNIYITKIWILKYQKWICIFFCILNESSKFKKKNLFFLNNSLIYKNYNISCINIFVYKNNF